MTKSSPFSSYFKPRKIEKKMPPLPIKFQLCDELMKTTIIIVCTFLFLHKLNV
jgi:hypothetical protein